MSRRSTIEQMLERQGRLWELRNRMDREGVPANMREAVQLEEGPWLSLSRQLGAGGTELGRRLSHELGWQLFDREILAAISKNTDTRTTVLSRLEQQAIGPINDYIGRLLDPSLPGQSSFLQETMRVIWGLARQGQAVIIGRGANWFLDSRYGLRVRVVAPKEFRTAQIAKREGLDLSAAARKVDEHDAAREAFVRKVHGSDVEDPHGYDIVINLGSLDLDAATRTVLTALRGKLSATHSYFRNAS